MRLLLLFTVFVCFSTPVLAVNELADGPACEEKIVSLINGAQKSIDAAVYSINRDSIIEALTAARQRGVTVRLLMDRTQLSSTKDFEHADRLIAAGIDLRIHTQKALMHTKMAIFDGVTASSGSFNWTNPAVERNYEVCNFFINDPDYAAQHQKLFDRFWLENPQSKSERWFRMRGKCGDILLLRS